MTQWPRRRAFGPSPLSRNNAPVTRAANPAAGLRPVDRLGEQGQRHCLLALGEIVPETGVKPLASSDRWGNINPNNG
jgi:hypothetical protein